MVHIAEEYWGGIAARMAELTGLEVPEEAFLAANALFWVLMAAVTVSIFRSPSRASGVVVLGTVVIINVALHLAGALFTAGYSPGLVSGLLLWLPLGVFALVCGHRVLPERSFRLGLLTGAVAHMLVPVIGLAFMLAFGGGW